MRQPVQPTADVLRRSWAALLLAVVVFVGGCTGPATPSSDTPTPAPPPFADCTALSAPPSGATPAAGPSRGATPGSLLPDLEVPCFTGGEPVNLRALRGPAVLNLWASWCRPCRKELPAFQRLPERAGGRVHVIGVNTRDDRSAAQSLGEKFGLTFPMLFDPDEKLLAALNIPPLFPVTVFIDEDGRIRHIDQSGALDDADLAAALEQHLGVVVPS